MSVSVIAFELNVSCIELNLDLVLELLAKGIADSNVVVSQGRLRYELNKFGIAKRRARYNEDMMHMVGEKKEALAGWSGALA